MEADCCVPAADPEGYVVDLVAEHVKNLKTPATPLFFNTLYYPHHEGADFVRGYPFSPREGVALVTPGRSVCVYVRKRTRSTSSGPVSGLIFEVLLNVCLLFGVSFLRCRRGVTHLESLPPSGYALLEEVACGWGLPY